MSESRETAAHTHLHLLRHTHLIITLKLLQRPQFKGKGKEHTGTVGGFVEKETLRASVSVTICKQTSFVQSGFNIEIQNVNGMK